MCLYPRFIKNRKYLPNNKNGGNPPQCKDERTLYVPIGCGKCIECKKQRSRQWQVRLQEDIRHDKRGKFVTMTFSDKALIELENEVHKDQIKQCKELENVTGKKVKVIKLTGYELDNEIATMAVRRFLERHRKHLGTSTKHWLVTELGQNKTERLHIHGIIWTTIKKKALEELWQYGNVNKRDKDWENNYCTERTVNYIVKYVNKIDQTHKEYNPIILCSPGIGKYYLARYDSELNEYKGKDTKETYTTRQGIQLPLPIYYRNKIYTEEQREQLWLNLLDKEKRYVCGIEIDVSQSEDDYENVLRYYRNLNNQWGYGSTEKDPHRIKYERQRRQIKTLTRLKKYETLANSALAQ